MTDRPDPSLFSTVEFPGEYNITLRVKGEMTRTIKAASLADAQAKAETWADDVAAGRGDAELDDVDDISVDCVRPRPKLYRVLQDGEPVRVSRLSPGDLPRDPDEQGF